MTPSALLPSARSPKGQGCPGSDRVLPSAIVQQSANSRLMHLREFWHVQATRWPHLAPPDSTHHRISVQTPVSKSIQIRETPELVLMGAFLLQSDVNVKLVMGLRSNVKKRVNIGNVAAGLNARKVIEKAVFDELVAMLDRSAPRP